MSEPKRPEGLAIAIDSLESIRILLGNLGHFHEDEIAKVDRIDQECVRALTQLRALKQPRLTLADVLGLVVLTVSWWKFSGDYKLPHEHLADSLRELGIEVETEKR